MQSASMETKANSNMSSPKATDFGTALCIITGASKGLGRSLARKIAGLLKPGSVLLLVARSGDKLQQLQADLVSSEAGTAGLQIRCVVADLSHKEGVESVVRQAKETSCSGIDRLLLFNNAASLGDVSRYARSFTNMDDVDSYLSFNVSSALCLTAGILGAFPHRIGIRRCIVNISSLCAVKPFSSWVLYCSGKAARDMIFRVLAEEEPDLRVLNYAPGPLDTDMLLQARTFTADATVKESISAMHSEGHVLTCEESAGKLLKVLLEDNYPSGAHLDVYDV